NIVGQLLYLRFYFGVNMKPYKDIRRSKICHCSYCNAQTRGDNKASIRQSGGKGIVDALKDLYVDVDDTIVLNKEEAERFVEAMENVMKKHHETFKKLKD